MAKINEVKKALAKAPEQTGLIELVRRSTKELGKALPTHLSPERMVRIALTSIRLNPKLAACTPESFLGSLFVLAQVGLEPIAGRAYLIPFKNSRKILVNGKEEWRSVMEVQAILGYKGLIELFYRHESALSIEMHTVRKNDQFDYQYGTMPYLKHKPAIGQDRGEAIGYYAIARTKGGGSIFRFMTRDECIEHGMKHSKTYDKTTGAFFPDSPWAKDTDAMCMKTVLIQLAKVLPLSIEMQRAIAIDETARVYRRGIDDMMDLPDVTVWDGPQSDGTPTLMLEDGESKNEVDKK